MLLSSIPCSNCLGAGLELEPGGVAVCRFCGTPNQVNGIICPRCEWVSPAKQETCPECGSNLFRTCPECQTRNWSGSDQCVKCGAAMDLLSYTTARLQQADTTNRLSSQQRFAREIKAQEARDAEKRTAYFAEMEVQRRKGLNESQARQKAGEQRLWLILAVVFILGLVLMGALALYLNSGG